MGFDCRIVFDGAAFTNTYQKGIARYAYELIERTQATCIIVLDAPLATQLPAKALALSRTERFPSQRRAYVTRLIRRVRRQFFPTRIPTTLWHSIYYGAPPTSKMPMVVTVHDLIAECLPHQHGDADREVARRKAAFSRAHALIAISQATADGIRRLYPEHADRVHVVHHGADHLIGEMPGIQNSARSREGDVLFVGNRCGYKNWTSALDAAASLLWPNPLRLQVVGPRFTPAELAAIRYRGLESRVIHLGELSDQGLSDAYRAAAVFLFPSLMEGFGFPLLEAQAHGTPVAASDIPVFHEVGGTAFVPFKPLDPDSIARAVAAAIEPARAAALQAAGLENVKRFTWAECASKTEAIWQRVMSETRLS